MSHLMIKHLNYSPFHLVNTQHLKTEFVVYVTMKKVIIALPGREFSGSFLKNWSNALVELTRRGYQVTMVNEYSSFVPFARMKTLGLNVLRGIDQKPFNGQVDYDVWVTLDSDMFFIPEQLIELIEDTNNYPVISGLYRMADLKHYAAIKNWDETYFKRHGTFQFLRPDDLEGSKKYINVAYNGMGFFACRRGVIEKLQYPYFSYPLQEIKLDDGRIIKDMCSEDVAFCKNLQDAGFDIMVNTTLKVGHEKMLVI